MKRKIIIDVSVCLALFLILSGVYLRFGTEKKIIPNEVKTVSDKTPTPVKIGDGIEAAGKYPTVISATRSVTRGSMAELKMQGVPGKTYSISVYYSSGKSASSVFSPVKADGSGYFVWEWRVPSNVKSGDFRIVVTSDDGYFQIYYTVE